MAKGEKSIDGTWQARRNVSLIHWIYLTYPSGEESIDNVWREESLKNCVCIIQYRLLRFFLLPIEPAGNSVMILLVWGTTLDTSHQSFSRWNLRKFRLEISVTQLPCRVNLVILMLQYKSVLLLFINVEANCWEFGLMFLWKEPGVVTEPGNLHVSI